MRKMILIGFATLIVVVGIGVAVGWLAGRGPAPTIPSAAPAPAPVVPVAVDRVSVPAMPPEPAAPKPAPVPVPPAVEPAPASVPPVVADAPTNTLMTNWADRVDDIIAADDDDTNKVQQLLALFPHLPKDGQVEVAQHLANLTPDEDYAPVAKLLENANLPEDVLDILLGDVLNRPNSLKLPELLTIAQNPDHPKAGEARDLLDLFLGQDYGDNWDLWRQKTAEWLQQNPD